MALPNAQQSVPPDPFDKDSFTRQNCHRTAANTDGTDGLDDNAARVSQITAPVLVAGQFRKLDWREVTLTMPSSAVRSSCAVQPYDYQYLPGNPYTVEL
jgi:hypothetical protein